MENKIDYTKIIPLKTFEDNFLPVIKSDEYNKLQDRVYYLKEKIKRKSKNSESVSWFLQKDKHGNLKYNFEHNIMSAQKIYSYINWILSKESNIIYKNIIMIDTFFDNDLFEMILRKYNSTTTDFINELNKIIVISKVIKGKSLKGLDKNISNILKEISSYYGITNYNLVL